MSDRFIHKTGLAVTDIEELVDCQINTSGHSDALRLVDNAERAFDQLLATPRKASLLSLDELPYEDIRIWHIDGFEHLIILYHEVADGIEIVRVLQNLRHMAALVKSEP